MKPMYPGLPRALHCFCRSLARGAQEPPALPEGAARRWSRGLFAMPRHQTALGYNGDDQKWEILVTRGRLRRAGHHSGTGHDDEILKATFSTGRAGQNATRATALGKGQACCRLRVAAPRPAVITRKRAGRAEGRILGRTGGGARTLSPETSGASHVPRGQLRAGHGAAKPKGSECCLKLSDSDGGSRCLLTELTVIASCFARTAPRSGTFRLSEPGAS